MTLGSGMGAPARAAIPNGQFAGRLFEFSDPELDRKYPRGVYVDLHGYPVFSVYARRAAEIADPPPGLSSDEVRVTDVIAANLIGASTGDPLWQQGRPPTVTPEGWTWVHEARTRRLFLIPAELNAAFRHHGGMATLNTDPSKSGLWHEGMLEPVAFERSGSVPEDAMLQLESQLGLQLPPSYRRFLAGTDGGRPLLPAVNLQHGFIVDGWLFGLRRQDMHQELIYANQSLYDRFTDEFLGVGYVQGGMLAVKVRGADIGSVWFFDDDDPRDNDGRDSTSICGQLLYRLGNDFDDFARHLVALPSQIVDISESAVRTGHARLIEGEPYLGSALPDHLRVR
jgi:hypothetical protein